MIPFSKYSGCGNDFILIDNRSGEHTAVLQAIPKLCDRHRGIGGDGVIFLETGKDFRMKIFNRDGSCAAMCGNGLRCLAQFILDLGHEKKTYTIQTKERLLSIGFKEELIMTDMGHVQDLKAKSEDCYTLNTGVPHAVFFVDALDTISVKKRGREIRFHPDFSPEGTNVNFVEKLSGNKIAIRTYERGVEDETLACGTGAAASAVAASLKWNLKSPIEVTFLSKETLLIDISENKISQIGSAVKLFDGFFDMKYYKIGSL